MSTDKIEHLDPDVIIAKVGILVKAWSKAGGDNSVKALCGGGTKYMKSGYFREVFFLLQVVHSPMKLTQFATSVEIDGGRARVATLKYSACLHCRGNPTFILLREATEDGLPVGAVLAKFGSISQAAHELHIGASLIRKANLMKERGGHDQLFQLDPTPRNM